MAKIVSMRLHGAKIQLPDDPTEQVRRTTGLVCNINHDAEGINLLSCDGSLEIIIRDDCICVTKAYDDNNSVSGYAVDCTTLLDALGYIHANSSDWTISENLTYDKPCIDAYYWDIALATRVSDQLIESNDGLSITYTRRRNIYTMPAKKEIKIKTIQSYSVYITDTHDRRKKLNVSIHVTTAPAAGMTLTTDVLVTIYGDIYDCAKYDYTGYPEEIGRIDTSYM